MLNLYDIAYGLAVGISAPLWLLIPRARRKVLAAFNQRMGHVPPRDGLRPAVWIHAVSLGEINATKMLADRLRALRPDLHLVISTTTNTGWERAQKLYGGPDVTLLRYPLDFTPAVTRALDHLRPSLVVLMELELWPNFLRQCANRSIPVLLINGRVTPTSHRKYKLIRPVVATMFRRLAAVCAQDPTYAGRFLDLGAPPDRVSVTGTMKFDTATVADRVDGDAALAAGLGLAPSEPLWVCGSTGPGEEQLILDTYRALLRAYPTLRLALIPRHPERFDEVASLIERQGMPLLRRSQSTHPQSQIANKKPEIPPILLGDTMGELRKFYSLARVIFVGRTLVDLGHRQHGSDMIEPAALARPVIVGPYTANFADAMSRFRADHAIVEVSSAQELQQAVAQLLADPAAAADVGRRAQAVVLREKGATDRHAQIILRHLPPTSPAPP
jgi:3-deoxy-D-manno-octulosonic-acid transferase